MGLESFHVPEKEDSPALSSSLDGVRPHRVIRRPKHLTNDYVFNLVSASTSSCPLLKCHLCLHQPFKSRKLWKGHLFLAHGVRSAQSQNLDREHVPVCKPVEVDHTISSHSDMPVLEDISEDESVEPFRESVQPAAVVSAIFVDADLNADNVETVNASTDDDLVVLDEVKKNHEKQIIATLMRKIQEIGSPCLSSSLVNDMQASFPEVSAERIAALFEWTICVSRIKSGEAVTDATSALDTSKVMKVRQIDQQVVFVGSQDSAAGPDDNPCRDPMLSGLDVMPPSRNSSPMKRSEELDESSPKSLDDDENFVGVFSKEAANNDAVMLLNDMFPELHPVVEEEFDFCE